jgi:hypothetical protein
LLVCAALCWLVHSSHGLFGSRVSGYACVLRTVVRHQGARPGLHDAATAFSCGRSDPNNCAGCRASQSVRTSIFGSSSVQPSLCAGCCLAAWSPQHAGHCKATAALPAASGLYGPSWWGIAVPVTSADLNLKTYNKGSKQPPLWIIIRASVRLSKGGSTAIYLVVNGWYQ